MEHYEVGTILVPPNEHDHLTTIQNKIAGTITQVNMTDITTLNPQRVHEVEKEYTKDHVIPHHPWVKNNTKCTLYLTHMKAPRRGYLQNENGHWHFLPGRNPDTSLNKNAPVPLEHFLSEGGDLLESAQLIKGW
eukprot:6394463-Ditylum_brightwellii.AAC.1